MLVMHVGGGDDGAMRQAALAVHANAHFHAEIPLLAFARLVHRRVTFLFGVSLNRVLR